MQERYEQVDLGADCRKLIDLAIESTLVETADDFLRLIRTHVRDLLSHDMAVCGIGGVSPKGSYIHKMLHHDYPIAYFDDFLQADGELDSPLMTRWRATQEPVIFQSGRDDAHYSPQWVKHFNKYGLRNTIGHGVRDLQGTMSSYFIFSRIPGEVGERHVVLLKLITPHLHQALARALTTIEDCADFPGAVYALLSERQRNVLYWLHNGKTNSEIARILDMTENNVNYHIDRILMKLQVRNRAQAVAKAIELGLLVNRAATQAPADEIRSTSNP